METFLDLVEPIVFAVDPKGVVTPLNKAAAQWLGSAQPASASLRELFGCASLLELQACAASGDTRTVARSAGGEGELRVRWDFAAAHGVAGESGEILAVGITWVPAGDAADLLAKETLIYKRLVLNILPRFIVDTLVERKAVQPKAYREATILFVDVVDFTKIAARLDPVTLLKRLDHYFSRFDEITATFGVEKIKTVGDAYMAASGIPHRKPLHAVDAALAALAITRFVAEERARGGAGDDAGWAFRVGIHSGSCISGVLGSGKYVFDLWGDAVTGAKELERAAAPGSIHVSAATRALLASTFELAPAGRLVLPGSGGEAVESFHVARLRAEYSDDAAGTVPNARFHQLYRAAHQPQVLNASLAPLPPYVEDKA